MPIQGLKNSSDFMVPGYFQAPDQLLNRKGEIRKVGIELEFAGIDLEQASNALKSALGGKEFAEGPHLTRLVDTELGDLEVILDTQYVHPNDQCEPVILKEGRELLASAVSGLVPYELVTEPISLNRLQLLDKATNALATAGAVGTEESIAYAFGLHLNPEIARDTPEYILSIIRSMIILDPEIRVFDEPDTTRQLMQWAKSYSEGYELLVMNPDYKPDLPQLIRDYLELNEGRSHHLDLIPVFRFLDEKAVEAIIGDKYPAKRPTFHYRLPDSGLGRDNWSIKQDWNLWVEIENYAQIIGEKEMYLWRKAKGTW